MKKLHTILFVLGAAFLVYLVWSVGLGELCREVGSLGYGLIPFILCEGVSEFIHVAGWRHCLSGAHRSLPMLLLFRIRMAGYAINYLTPTAAMGGEVTKAALLASQHRGPEAVTGVLIGKICFAFSHLLFVVIGSITCLWRIDLPRTLWLGMSISGGLIASGMVVFLLIQKHGKLGVLIRWLASRKLGGSMTQRAAQGISEVDRLRSRAVLISDTATTADQNAKPATPKKNQVASVIGQTFRPRLRTLHMCVGSVD
jgi:uncharacterized membrane protein YbhN (UPF0104 family)